jgi:hypothetical protein
MRKSKRQRNTRSKSVRKPIMKIQQRKTQKRRTQQRKTQQRKNQKKPVRKSRVGGGGLPFIAVAVAVAAVAVWYLRKQVDKRVDDRFMEGRLHTDQFDARLAALREDREPPEVTLEKPIGFMDKLLFVLFERSIEIAKLHNDFLEAEEMDKNIDKMAAAGFYDP